jgi:hypothetical protein
LQPEVRLPEFRAVDLLDSVEYLGVDGSPGGADPDSGELERRPLQPGGATERT